MAYGYWYNQSGLGDTCDVRVSVPVSEPEIVYVPPPQPDCVCPENSFPWWAVVLAFLLGNAVKGKNT